MCRKIRQKIHGSWKVIRECAILGKPGEGTGNEHHCSIKQGTYDIYHEICTCNSKDGCNSALKNNCKIYLIHYISSIIFISFFNFTFLT